MRSSIQIANCVSKNIGNLLSDRRFIKSTKHSRSLSACTLINRRRRTWSALLAHGNQIRSLCEKASHPEHEGTTSSASTDSHHGDLYMNILSSSLKHVPEMGWTDAAIARGVTDLSLPPLTVGIIERGSVELVKYFLMQKRAHVRDIMTTSSTSDLNGSSNRTVNRQDDSLYRAISAHIDVIKPFVKTWPSAMALLADPRHLDITSGLALDVVNDLCDYLGIQGSRLDWYSERALLLMVYTSTELFMLTDKSEDLSDTKAYLIRCIETYRGARESSGSFQTIQTVVQGALSQLLFTKNPFSNRK